jgi:hypothetical protein
LTPTSPSDRDAEAAGRFCQPWLRLAALALVVVALGLPINDLARYALLVIATVLIAVGTVSRRWQRWLAAVAAVAVCVLGQILVAPPGIEEGHNIFLVDRAGGALETGLPREAFRQMAAAFDARYPPERRCDPATYGCWRNQGFPDQPFAFSADGSWQRPAYSRRVTHIDFDDPVWLRLGFINEYRYNWNSEVSDVNRGSQDRRLAALVHRWRLEMPWFVMYRFPDAYVGSALCGRGQVLWEGIDEKFETITHASMQCRALTPDDIGRRIFGVAISETLPLAMRLQPSAMIELRQLVVPIFATMGVVAVLGFLAAGSWTMRRVVLAVALVAVTLVVVVLNDATFVGGVRPFDAGDDGLVYDGFARTMLRRLLAGDWVGALEGSEPVFYFTPGLRYLRAVEHLVFGESYLGYLSLMLALPFLVFATFRRFLPLRWALASVLIFAAIPIGVLFGSSLVQYVKWAARGFADPASYVFFLAGFVLLVGRTAAGPRNGFATAWGCGLLFALAIFVRPNVAPAAGILLAGAGLAALRQGQYRRVAGLCAGFLPVLGIALHNWVYGGQLVLFTTTATLAMTMPPSAYLAAFVELLHLDLAGEHVVRAVRQIGGWLAGPGELVVMAPLHAAAIVVVVRVVLWRCADPWLRLTAGATLVQQCVGIFFFSYGRYYYLTWLLTLLVVLVWLHAEGIDMFRQRFPALAERVTKHPARAALVGGLARISRMLEA